LLRIPGDSIGEIAIHNSRVLSAGNGIITQCAIGAFAIRKACNAGAARVVIGGLDRKENAQKYKDSHVLS
jgi:hypothetical protein